MFRAAANGGEGSFHGKDDDDERESVRRLGHGKSYGGCVCPSFDHCKMKLQILSIFFLFAQTACPSYCVRVLADGEWVIRNS